MITAAQEDYIEDHAYVPEHIPHYVTAISQTEPFLFGDFLVYAKKGHLIFVGYPLKEPFEEKRMEKALEDAIKRLKPESVSLIAPSIPSSLNDSPHPPSDHYYRLDLSDSFHFSKIEKYVKAGRQRTLCGKKQRL